MNLQSMVFLLFFLLMSKLFCFAQPEKKLEQLGLQIPKYSAPIANYVKWVKDGNKLYLAGHGHCGNPTRVDRGKVGKDLTVEEGYLAARNVGLCMLATIKDAIGDLSKVKRIIKVMGMVNSTEDFVDHPQVMNGFSDLMVEVFGDKGKHARSAVGMNSLPLNLAVEIEMLLEIEED